MTNPTRLYPILAGAALLTVGAFLRRWNPDLLDMPERRGRSRPEERRRSRVARKSRDGIARVLPDNLTDSFGRSLMIMGAGLIAIRALDQLVEDADGR